MSGERERAKRRLGRKWSISEAERLKTLRSREQGAKTIEEGTIEIVEISISFARKVELDSPFDQHTLKFTSRSDTDLLPSMR